MKRRALYVLMCACAAVLNAQPRSGDDANVVGRQISVRLMPLYQHWSTDGGSFSESGSRVMVYYPVSRNASLSLRGAFGYASGDISTLSGLNDLELSGKYYIEPANLVFSLDAGLPSGKTGLTAGEFLTSVLIANSVFRLQVPNFGGGFRLQPGVVWALPVNDDVVIGAGASFQFRASYNPLENFGTYDPGDEVTGTVGAEVRLDETASLSGDLVYTRYARDQVDGLDIYAAGDKVLAALQFRKYLGRNELLLLGTFRTKARPDVAIGTILLPAKDRVEPDQGGLGAVYTARFSDRISAAFSLEGRFFEKTTDPFSGLSMVGIGLSPEFQLSRSVTIPVRLQYTTGGGNGTLSGVEVGAGITVQY